MMILKMFCNDDPKGLKSAVIKDLTSTLTKGLFSITVKSVIERKHILQSFLMKWTSIFVLYVLTQQPKNVILTLSRFWEVETASFA